MVKVLERGPVCLLPLVPLMREGESLAQDADRRIYESNLPRPVKADMLTILTLLSGIVSKALAEVLLYRRRDIMIESPAYELIKREGIEEGVKKGLKEGLLRARREDILALLKLRLSPPPEELETIAKRLEHITDLERLQALLILAAQVSDIQAFEAALKTEGEG